MGDGSSKRLERQMFHGMHKDQLASVHSLLPGWVPSQGREVSGVQIGDRDMM